MKKLFPLLLCFAFLSAHKQPPGYFSGKIVYKYQFKDANGNDITAAMAEVIGKEQHYFINDSNYKAYDENHNMQQLYNSNSNLYYQIAKDKSVQKIDASTSTSKIFTVKQLNIKEKIAGYQCNAIEVITDEATSTYYYSPLIKINPVVYKKHSHGEWDKILQATNGSLPLKFKMINHKQGFITWISYATAVEQVVLKDKDFTLPKDSAN